MKGNAKNYSGSESRNYSKTKEYDTMFDKCLGGMAAGVAVGGFGAYLIAKGVETKDLYLAISGGVTMAGGTMASTVGVQNYRNNVEREKEREAEKKPESRGKK